MRTLDQLERDELIQKLTDNGYGQFFKVLADNEKAIYTRKGRFNKCGAMRVLGITAKQLKDIMEDCRRLLEQ